jgi:DNA-binding NarL/FixJ family response regulator
MPDQRGDRASRPELRGDRGGLVQCVVELLGNGSVATIIGEAGIGKTTVLAEVLGRLHADWIWTVSCLQVEADLGLGVLADLFAALPASAIAALPAPQRRAIDVVLYRAEPDDGLGITDRLLAVTTLSVLRQVLAAGSVLLAVDDLQWCDRSSLAVLTYAAERLPAPAFRLVGTARTAAGPAADALDLRGPTVTVAPLTPTETREMVRSMAGTASGREVQTAVRMSGGNPFFARELAMALAAGESDRLPVSLKSALGKRLAELPHSARPGLLDVAVRGAPAAGEVALDELDLAFQSGVLEAAGDRVRFSHPLLARAAIESATPAAIRSARQRAAANTADPVLAALHRARSEPASVALAAEIDGAAAIAWSRCDWESARSLAALALTATPGGSRPLHRVLALAECERVAGTPQLALRLAREVLAARPSPDVLIRASRIVLEFGDDHLANAEQLGQLAALPGLPAWTARDLRRAQEVQLWKAGRTAEAVQLIAEALEQTDLGAETWSNLTASYAVRLRFVGEPFDFDQVVKTVEIEREANAQRPDAVPLNFAVANAAIVAYFDDRHVLAQEWCEQAQAAADITGEPPPSYYYRGMLACRTGQLQQSAALLEPLPAIALGQDKADALCRLALTLVWIDDTTEVRDIVAECDDLLPPSNHRILADVRFIEGFDLLLAGRYREALPSLRRSADHLEACGQREPSRTPALLAAAEAAAMLGDAAGAEVFARQLRDQAAALASRWGHAAADRADGLIAAARHDHSAAFAALGQSADSFLTLGVPLEAGRSFQVLGITQRRAGERRKARTALSAARDIFAEAGSARLVTVTEAELGRISGRVTAADSELTAAERPVAELAAQGLRNKEIASTLHLSVKTVETHLSRAYHKLGVSSKAELAGRLHS